MIKKVLVAVALLAGTTAAHADWNGHRHGHGHHQRHFHQNSGDPGAALIGGLIGGMILNQMMQAPRQQYYYQPVCQTVFLGRVWNGYMWVEQYQHLEETEAVLGSNLVYNLGCLSYIHRLIPYCHYLDLIKVLQKCQ